MKQISAKIDLDSANPRGVRLTTLICTFPRMILAEVNTHRRFSRNSASSRAIPVEKMIAAVEEDPFIPTHWTTAGKGMSGGPEVTDPAMIEECRFRWLNSRDRAIRSAESLMQLGLAKQVVNRVLEPFMWHIAIISATEWGNFLALRDHPKSEPHFRDLAHLILEELKASIPIPRETGEWHLPLTHDLHEVPIADRVQISTARCARISYLTHDGRRDPDEDLRLYRGLSSDGHWSPFEHPARATNSKYRIGNFVGWLQHRKDFPDEERDHPDVSNHEFSL